MLHTAGKRSFPFEALWHCHRLLDLAAVGWLIVDESGLIEIPRIFSFHRAF